MKNAAPQNAAVNGCLTKDRRSHRAKCDRDVIDELPVDDLLRHARHRERPDNDSYRARNESDQPARLSGPGIIPMEVSMVRRASCARFMIN